MNGEIIEKPTVRCKNCNEPYLGYFCPSCGQKHIAQRYTLRDSLAQFSSAVFNLERGLLYTSVRLMRNPGKVLRDYLSGITIPYFPPFRFLFIWLTIMVFIMLTFGVTEAIEESVVRSLSGEGINPLQKQLMGLINSYMHILITISMPVLAGASWLFFRKAGLNYAEHLVISLFAYGETVLISLLLMFLFFVNEEWYLSLNTVVSVITMSYLAYVYLSFFEGRKWVIILKTIGTYLIWFLGLFILIVIYITFYLIWLRSSNPEVLRQLQSAAGQ